MAIRTVHDNDVEIGGSLTLTGMLETVGELFDETYQRTQFVVYVGSREFVVSILDAGPKFQSDQRFMVEVTDEQGRKATGNNASSFGEALDIVHWHDVGLQLTAKGLQINE